MASVVSKDGSNIGYDRQGSGPVVIFVAGATQYRAVDETTPSMATDLADRFTIINYDRRGRGESSDMAPYAVAREIEDIEALIDANGGTAGLYGMSSGAVLALEAATALRGKVTSLLMYEPPINVDEKSAHIWVRHGEMADLAAKGEADTMLAKFMAGVGMPPEAIEGFRQSPAWGGFAAVGLTLEHDFRIMAEAVDGDRMPERWKALDIPVLVVNGDSSFPFIEAGAAWVAEAVPVARRQVLPGQSHQFDPKVLGPVLAQFFGA